MSYLAYRNGSTIVVKNQKLTVLCDYLFIEGLNQHSIVPVENEDNFKELGLEGLKILLMNLRGDSILDQGLIPDGLLRKECLRLSRLIPDLDINGWNAQLQAAWIETHSLKNCGYSYNPHSTIPIKL